MATTTCPFCGEVGTVATESRSVIYKSPKSNSTDVWWDIGQHFSNHCSSCKEKFVDEATHDSNFYAYSRVIDDYRHLSSKIKSMGGDRIEISNDNHPSHQIAVVDIVEGDDANNDEFRVKSGIRKHFIITISNIKTSASVEFTQVSARKRGLIEHLLSLTDAQCGDYLKKIPTKGK